MPQVKKAIHYTEGELGGRWNGIATRRAPGAATSHA